jgi:hypothetical protein
MNYERYEESPDEKELRELEDKIAFIEGTLARAISSEKK